MSLGHHGFLLERSGLGGGIFYEALHLGESAAIGAGEDLLTVEFAEVL